MKNTRKLCAEALLSRSIISICNQVIIKETKGIGLGTSIRKKFKTCK